MSDFKETLRRVLRGMGDPDRTMADDFARQWLEHWETALNKARDGNPHWVHDMLATEHPVPAPIARQLLDLKVRRGAPPALAETPEQVVRTVYNAIADGHKFSSTDASPDLNPALKEAARRLHCRPSTIERYWKACPAQERHAIQFEVEVVRGLSERLASE